MKSIILAIGLIALIMLTTTQASEEIQELTVIGLPAIKLLNSNLPPEAIVIKREQLAQFGSASLASVLEYVPEISINQNGGRGSFNSLFLRGADPNFTQIRIDGVVINNATNTRGGAFDIGSINVQTIERIEIISDASSAVYGSQALAGVINIVTRVSGTQASIEIDSDNGETASIFVANDNIALSVITERPGSNIEGNRYKSDELNVKASWQWMDAHKLQWVARYQDYTNKAFPDDSGGSLFAASEELERREGKVAHIGAHYEYLMMDSDLFEFNAHFFTQEEDRASPAILPGMRDPIGLPEINEKTDYLRTNIEARYTKNINKHMQWRSAIAWEQERGEQTGQLNFSFFQAPTDFDLTRVSLSATQSFDFNITRQIKASTSIRIDNTESDTVISPRLSISYAFDNYGFENNAQLLYVNVGEGFKQASIYALADPLIGNTSLLDETARSIQVGHRYQKDNWYIKSSIYYYNYQNLIDFEPGPPPILVNRDSVQISGVESTISYTQKNWLIDIFQAYSSNKVEGSTEDLRQRPSYRAGIQANIDINDKLIFWMKSLYVGKRLDSSIPTADITVPSYTVSDLGFSLKINSQLKLNAQWKNVFSKRYSTSIGNQIDEDTLLIQLTFGGE